MDFGIHGGPGTNPLLIPRDYYTHFVLGSMVGARNTKMNQITSLFLEYSQILGQAGIQRDGTVEIHRIGTLRAGKNWRFLGRYNV